MDLSHWNLVDNFTLWEAAYLAAGVDPKLCKVSTAEQVAKGDLIYRELDKSYESAISSVSFDLMGGRFDPLVTVDSIFSPARNCSDLPSIQLIEEVEFCIEVGEAFRLSRFYSNPDDDPIEMPTFSRQRLDAWFRAKRFKSIYSFVPAPEESGQQNQSGSQPTTRNHVSDKLAKVNQAAAKFWERADRDDRGTHPDNAMVVAWLIEQGLSPTLAEKAATIIRPEWAPTGRKPEE